VIVGVAVGGLPLRIRRTWSADSVMVSPPPERDTPTKRICTAFASAGVVMTLSRPGKSEVVTTVGGGLALL
jgi:hypothetical protein